MKKFKISMISRYFQFKTIFNFGRQIIVHFDHFLLLSICKPFIQFWQSLHLQASVLRPEKNNLGALK